MNLIFILKKAAILEFLNCLFDALNVFKVIHTPKHRSEKPLGHQNIHINHLIYSIV